MIIFIQNLPRDSSEETGRFNWSLVPARLSSGSREDLKIPRLVPSTLNHICTATMHSNPDADLGFHQRSTSLEVDFSQKFESAIMPAKCHFFTRAKTGDRGSRPYFFSSRAPTLTMCHPIQPESIIHSSDVKTSISYRASQFAIHRSYVETVSTSRHTLYYGMHNFL